MRSDASEPSHHHPLTVLADSPSHVLCLDKRHRQQHMGALLRLLFLPQPHDSPHAIASLIETDDEISLVAGATPDDWWAEYCQSADGLQADPIEWVPIRVGEENEVWIDETGVIAAQAKVLAGAGLSILYHSTFYADYTFVQRSDIGAAAAAFEAAGFTLSTVPEHPHDREGQTRGMAAGGERRE